MTGSQSRPGHRRLAASAPPLFTKIALANGATGLGAALTLQWTPVPNEGNAVCWDTVNNDACDTLWWPASTATTGPENLAPGTYYWPFDLMEPWALRAIPSDVATAAEWRGGPSTWWIMGRSGPP